MTLTHSVAKNKGGKCYEGPNRHGGIGPGRIGRTHRSERSPHGSFRNRVTLTTKVSNYDETAKISGLGPQVARQLMRAEAPYRAKFPDVLPPRSIQHSSRQHDHRAAASGVA